MAPKVSRNEVLIKRFFTFFLRKVRCGYCIIFATIINVSLIMYFMHAKILRYGLLEEKVILPETQVGKTTQSMKNLCTHYRSSALTRIHYMNGSTIISCIHHRIKISIDNQAAK